MGRVIDDLGKCYYIQDFVVRTDYQRKGIEWMMMDRIIKFIGETAISEVFV